MPTFEDISKLEDAFISHSKAIECFAERIIEVGQNIRKDNLKMMEQLDKLIARMTYTCNKTSEKQDFNKPNYEIERIFKILNKCALDAKESNVGVLQHLTTNSNAKQLQLKSLVKKADEKQTDILPTINDYASAQNAFFKFNTETFKITENVKPPKASCPEQMKIPSNDQVTFANQVLFNNQPASVPRQPTVTFTAPATVKVDDSQSALAKKQSQIVQLKITPTETKTEEISSILPTFNFAAPALQNRMPKPTKNNSLITQTARTLTSTEMTHSSLLSSFSFNSATVPNTKPSPVNSTRNMPNFLFNFNPPTLVKQEQLGRNNSSEETRTEKLNSAETKYIDYNNRSKLAEDVKEAVCTEGDFGDYENINSDYGEEDQLLLEDNCVLTTQDAYVSPMKSASSKTPPTKCKVQVFDSGGVIYIAFMKPNTSQCIVSHYIYRNSKLIFIIENQIEYLYSTTSETKKILLEFNDSDSLQRFITHFNDGVQMAKELEFDELD